MGEVAGDGDQGLGTREQGTENGDLARRLARGRVGEGNGVCGDRLGCRLIKAL